MAGGGRKPCWKVSATSAENATRVLPRLAARFFEAGRAAVGATPNALSLHKLRLHGKRLRYSLELFAPCYGPGIDQHLSDLKKIQSYLGEINDCVATARLIQKAGLAGGPDGTRLAAFLNIREQQRIAGFVDHWRADFDAPGRLGAWLSYLKNCAGSEAPAASGPTAKIRSICKPETAV